MYCFQLCQTLKEEILLLFAAIDTSDKGEVATEDAMQRVGLCWYYTKSRDI